MQKANQSQQPAKQIFHNLWKQLKNNPKYSSEIFKSKILLTWEKYQSKTIQQNTKAIDFKSHKLIVATKDNHLLLKLNQNKILFLKWYHEKYPEYDIRDIVFKYLPNIDITPPKQPLADSLLSSKLNEKEKNQIKKLRQEKIKILKTKNIKNKIAYLIEHYQYYRELVKKYGLVYPQSPAVNLKILTNDFTINEQYPMNALSSSFLNNNDDLQLYEVLNR